jgi:S-methylmethionine-dependent homocysteine/selenocysteine methylase
MVEVGMKGIKGLLEARKGVLVLDGGLATELENQGADLTGSLWSAKLL